MVGLVLVFLLKVVGYDVKIFEVNNWVGGCIEMVRMEDIGLYLDVGVMRILYLYILMMIYIRKFGL